MLDVMAKGYVKMHGLMIAGWYLRVEDLEQSRKVGVRGIEPLPHDPQPRILPLNHTPNRTRVILTRVGDMRECAGVDVVDWANGRCG